MSSNGPSGNCRQVPNEHLIVGHVLGGQNGGSTPTLCRHMAHAPTEFPPIVVVDRTQHTPMTRA